MASRRRSRASVVGVDLGATSAKLALVDGRGRVRDRRALSTQRYRGPRALIAVLVAELRRLIGGSVQGIGIGAPGLVNHARGLVHQFVNIRGWHDVPLAHLVARATGLPTVVDNDANVMALGELRYGAGRGTRNILAVTLGTGVGGAVIVGGRLYRGVSGSAGEIGHMTLHADGPACPCGNHGCLERYVGNQALEARARHLLKRRVSLEEVSRLARSGHRLACQLWREAGRHLGTALAGYVDLMNPERIIIGGGVAQAGPVLFRAIRETIDARAMRVPARAVRIVRAGLGTDAGIIGAAVLVREQLGQRQVIQ
ncbi:MAG: ROK family protein [Candidatus Omnitrophica bacterium]|nr:ROK family protein [Candidatus Omnitrophota bacterium]